MSIKSKPARQGDMTPCLQERLTAWADCEGGEYTGIKATKLELALYRHATSISRQVSEMPTEITAPV